MIEAPIGTDTALLLRTYVPPSPLLLTTKEPGPVAGESGNPTAGKLKLTSDGLRPGSPGLSRNGPTLPPRQAQNKSIATPLTVSNPPPPNATIVPCFTTVSTLLVA